jgi:hypothetical protein
MQIVSWQVLQLTKWLSILINVLNFRDKDDKNKRISCCDSISVLSVKFQNSVSSLWCGLKELDIFPLLGCRKQASPIKLPLSTWLTTNATFFCSGGAVRAAEVVVVRRCCRVRENKREEKSEENYSFMAWDGISHSPRGGAICSACEQKERSAKIKAINLPLL